MKIISWNVNGIRAAERKGAFEEIMKHNPDILCIQETKAEREQLSEELANPDDYHAYFFSSTERKGHSGSALYSKTEPSRIEYGLPTGIDHQGRTITAYFDDFVVVNCYFPNGASKTSPLDYKLKFYDAFLEYIEDLKTEHTVIATGDFNVAHEAIDLARPKDNENRTGFLPEERAWVDAVIESGWADVWRQRNPNKTDVYTYWDLRTRARDRNIGWRIDYFFVPQEFMPKVKNIEILGDVTGSDHAPLVLEI